MALYENLQHDNKPGRRSAQRLAIESAAEPRSGESARRHSSPRRDGVAKSGIAVTQVCLDRNNVVLIARLSAATRLYPGGYMTRIALLRLFLREMIEAAIEPATVVTRGALAAYLKAHFETLRHTPGHPLTELATNLGRWMHPKVECLPVFGGHGASFMGAAAAPEPTTLRLPTAEIVAIDNYRCDIRQASGLCISRSAILRATIESFARAFQV